MEKAKQKDQWGSRLGFILATAGSAVGLGNLQRFPYLTAECGGSAFVFIYILCVLVLGIPLMLLELSIGRHTQKNPVDGIKQLSPKGPWKYVGVLGILTSFFILTYYLIASGWTLGYVFQMAGNQLIPYDEFVAMPHYVIPCTAAMLLTVVLIVKKGLQNGIEFWNKILMPSLVLLLLILLLRSVTLPNSWEGITYYLYPDFSEVNGKVFLYALSQAFFSLSIGEAVLFTYGSYCSKKENIVKSAYCIAFFDTAVAILSGLILFPAIFSFGVFPQQGVGLIFHIMPGIFMQMPFGNILGAFFFLMLSFAALTTCIALLEIPVSYLVNARGWSRNAAAWTLAAIAFIISIPSALSKGANVFLSTIKIECFNVIGFQEIMDFVWGALAMIIGSFFLTIFASRIWGIKNAVKELRSGCSHFSWQGTLWGIIIKYITPLAIAIVFFGQFL